MQHKSSPSGRRTTREQGVELLRRLEERLRHELLGDEERCELRDRVLALRRRPGG